MARRWSVVAVAGAVSGLAFAPGQAVAAVSADCTFNGVPLKGDVQIVESFPDFRVKPVQSFPDLRVQLVASFPDGCGRWRLVESFPDFTIQFVDAHPDFTVSFVQSFPGTP